MGRYDLQLGEAEFWGLTLKEFRALAERYEICQEWLNYRPALICSVLANTVRDPKHKRQPYTPQDFMPGIKSPKPRQTAKQILASVKMLNLAHGGNVLEK